MTTLTAELRQEIEKAGNDPVRIEDPDTHSTYVLLKAEVYDRIRPLLASSEPPTDQIPEGIRRSKEAFLRDLPGLLTRKRWRGRWVLYHGNDQVGISRNPQKLLRECSRRGINDDGYYLGVIEPHPEEPEEIDRSFFEFEDFEPAVS
jgi:hypothetical protein